MEDALKALSKALSLGKDQRRISIKLHITQILLRVYFNERTGLFSVKR